MSVKLSRTVAGRNYEPIGFPDISPELTRESGFLAVLDLLKAAKRDRSEKLYLVRFHYVRPRWASESGNADLLKLRDLNHLSETQNSC